MKRVTQRVAAVALGDLVRQPPRAAIAFECDGRASAVPVALRGEGGALRVGVPREMLPAGGFPAEVALLVDDGCWWFELRAIHWRGALAPTQGPDAPDLAWFAFAPRREAAWSYGELHEEPA